MSWEDEDFGTEFAKFKVSSPFDLVDPSPNIFVLYIEPDYNSLVDYENHWRKKRKKIQVNEIQRAVNSPYQDDIIVENSMLWLDMGARLFNVVKDCKIKKFKYIKLIKTTNPLDKFDTWYSAKQYKLDKQSKITKSTTKK